jgi:hypothetical protein
MKILFAFLIFCLVLFFYLHIQFHLKQSDDLEMYELDNASKERLEEIADLRQPVLFDFENHSIQEITNQTYLLSNYSSFDMKVRTNPFSILEKEKENEEYYIPLPLKATVQLLKQDEKSVYFTENNMEFLQETGISKKIQHNDGFLRPYMMSNYYYDILIGSKDTCTPLRYEINYRTYFLMTEGTAQIKLIPPKNSKYLHPQYNYENFEWSSPLNVWNIQPNYKTDFDKIKSLEFTLIAGKTLFLPAYWWYTIRFSKNASITTFKYRTYMNNLAISPYLFLHFLQMQNIKRETSKKIPLQELNQLQTKEQTNEQIKEQTNEQIKEQTNEQINEKIKKGKEL